MLGVAVACVTIMDGSKEDEDLDPDIFKPPYQLLPSLVFFVMRKMRPASLGQVFCTNATGKKKKPT